MTFGVQPWAFLNQRPAHLFHRTESSCLALLEEILRHLEAGGLQRVASTFTSDKLILNGAGEFAIGASFHQDLSKTSPGEPVPGPEAKCLTAEVSKPSRLTSG